MTRPKNRIDPAVIRFRAVNSVLDDHDNNSLKSQKFRIKEKGTGKPWMTHAYTV